VKLGIRAKLFLVSLGLIAASVLPADAFLSNRLQAELTARLRADLFVRLELVQRWANDATAPFEDVAAWDALADDLSRRARARTTLILKDGRVVGESHVGPAGVADLDNHVTRPEVVEALQTGRGSITRLSQTVGRRMMYVAMPFHRDGQVVGVARLAMPLDEVDAAVRHQRGLVLGGTGLALAVAVLISTLASHWMARAVRTITEAARRMAAGDLALRTRAIGEDELAETGRALDQLAGNLASTLAELRNERDLLGRVLGNMREGVLVLDSEGRIALMNSALREMLLLGSEVVGQLPRDVTRNPELTQVLERARAGETVTTELEVGDLKPRKLSVTAASFSGEPGGVLAVFVDLTEVRRLEALRKDFVANVSHELRTPVASVTAATETLRGVAMSDPKAALEFVDIIERNAQRLHRLLEDLLDLSRIEAREFRLKVEPIDLRAATDHVLSLSQHRAAAKGMILRNDVAPSLGPVRADRRALEQVFTNLVENAVKYCPERASITVRAVSQGREVRIEVEDTGPGIEAKHLPRLFERFYRVDAGRSRDVGGTGLGLSIVKHLVEAMGGRVGVDSRLGRGTKFHFTLPAAEVS
jgi:two-component system, OmpR family, phosphate regulon sensor histidine kinase PhoR